MKHALVTGAAGFIGSHLAAGLLRQGWQVTGLDARHPASDPVAAENLAELTPHPRFRLARADIATADLAHVLEGVQVPSTWRACLGRAGRGGISSRAI